MSGFLLFILTHERIRAGTGERACISTTTKDIPYSNSSIEAINKTLKYRYLYLQSCKADQLQSKLQESIHDYNHIRPHGSLNGLTPDEAYLSEVTPNIKAQMTKARTERIEKNRTFNCKTCEK